jgi:hypothetical protein
MTSSDNDHNPILPEPAVNTRYRRNAIPAVTRNAITHTHPLLLSLLLFRKGIFFIFAQPKPFA